jgi:kinesin family protein 18/19
MLGNGDGEGIENAGIMPRALSDLFKLIENSKSKNIEYRLNLSYLEIYNEAIRDLLSDSDKALELREDPYNGSQVVNLSEIVVTNTTDVFKLLTKGNSNRTVESTNLNEASSRSHAILQIVVESKDKSDSLDPKVIVGKFVLVDLAGSERSSTTKNTGMRLIEGGNINRSLLALGTCINKLVETSEKGTKVFIPWRDSKLTRILKVKYNCLILGLPWRKLKN